MTRAGTLLYDVPGQEVVRYLRLLEVSPYPGVPGPMMRPTATAYQNRHVSKYSAHIFSCAFHRGEKGR